jgi:replicative DNA helicase Mcm
MSLKEVKKYIVDSLSKAPDKTMKWDDIYNYLINYYPKSTVSRAKSDLIDEGIIKEIKTVEGKKIILVREPLGLEDILEDSCDKKLELIFEMYRDKLVKYFKSEYEDFIIKREDYVVVDLENLYKFGFFEVLEHLIEEPDRILKFLRECYEEAFYTLLNERLPDGFTLSVSNIPNVFRIVKTLEDIRSSHVGKLIEFEGIVAIASKVKTYISKKYLTCNKCGYSWYMENDIFNPPTVKSCPKCGGEIIVDEDKSIHVDIQELKIQQPLELMANPEDPPKYITVIAKGKNAGVYSGRVKITGIVKKIRKKRRLDVYDFYVEALNIERLEGELNMDLSEEDIKKIKKIAKRRDVIDILAERLIPEIRGYNLVKKAVFLQQIKGTRKRNKRYNFNILLVADPGIGKTVILRKIAKIPGNVYASLTTSTAVGLTAAVEKEKTEIGDNTWVVKPGVLVKANKGTACIDELTLKKDAQQAVLEAMESQTIHVSKGGINTKLPAETAVLAACNPKYGRFDDDLPIAEQIDIYPPLLDRFDLIFPIRDVFDESKDRDIAEHIIKTAIAESSDDEVEGYDFEYVEVDGEKIKVDFDFVVKYIVYARQKKAILTEKAKKVLVDFYVEVKKKNKISARQLEAAIRLAEAIAKARLKDEVDEEDAKEAMEIILQSLKDIAYDPEEGIDICRIMGFGKKDRDVLKTVYEAVKTLSSKRSDGAVFHDELVEYCESLGLNKNDIERAIIKLKRIGDIDEYKPGKYRLL